MTINSAVRKAGPFLGDGVATVFPFSFKVFTKNDVKVTLTNASGAETVLVLDSDYSVAVNADQTVNPGGAVTYPATLAIGFKLTVTGALPNLQPTSLPNNGPFYPKTIEDAEDRAVILIQQLQEQVDRSIKVNVSDPPLSPLPSASARANTLLGCDAVGNIVAVPEPASIGAGDLLPYSLVSGVDFAPGATTLPLPRAPGSPGNIKVNFDASPQDFTQWNVSGQTLTIPGGVPGGVTRVWGYIGTTLSTQIPPDESITDTKLVSSSGTLAAIVTKLKYIASGIGAVYRSVMDKLRDQVHVMDFGAVGDGVTPASAAIQAAIATGRGKVIVSRGTYLIDTAIELRDNLVIECDKDAVFIPASNTLTIFKASTHAYFSRIHGATVDGNGKTGITAFDLTNFRLQAGLFNCYVTKVAIGAYFRSGCFGAKCDNFTSYYSVPNPIVVVENGSVIDITNPCLDNIEGPGNHTGNGIYVTAAGVVNEGVRIIGGFIQGFDYGVLDSGNGTRIEGTYFEQAGLGDIFFNGAIASSARDTQHSANVGPCAIKMRNCDGVRAFYNKVDSGGRVQKYDVDSTNTNCSRAESGSRFGNDYPLGDVTYLPQHSPRSNQVFTPTVAGSTSAGAGTYTAQQGRISLHGEQVEVALTVGWTAHSGTGKLVLKGIPIGYAPQSYSPSSNPPGPLRIAQVVIEGVPYTGPILNAYFNGNGTDISITQLPTAGTLPQLFDLPTTGTVHLKMSYNANA